MDWRKASKESFLGRRRTKPEALANDSRGSSERDCSIIDSNNTIYGKPAFFLNSDALNSLDYGLYSQTSKS